MRDEFVIEICDAEGNVIATQTDSLLNYAMRTLENPASSQETKTMIVDMLNYGAAAQKYFNYDAANPVNAALTSEQQAWASGERAYTDIHGGNNYKATRLGLDHNIWMQMAFDNVEVGMDVEITFTNHYDKPQTITNKKVEDSDGYKVVNIDEIVVADGSAEVTVKIYDSNRNVVAQAVDSVESYAARSANNSRLYELCQMIMRFVDSSRAHFDSQNS